MHDLRSIVMTDDLLHYLGSLIAGVLIGVLGFIAAKTKMAVKHMNIMSHKALNRNLRIVSTMQEMRGLIDADRVMLYQFHNGDYYASGESAQKISMTHYVLNRGVEMPTGIGEYHQNVPASYVVYLLDYVRQHRIWFGHTKGAQADTFCYFRPLLIRDGVKSCLFAGLYGKNDVMLGLILVAWLDPVIEPSETERDKIAEYVNTIVSDMTFQNYN